MKSKCCGAKVRRFNANSVWVYDCSKCEEICGIQDGGSAVEKKKTEIQRLEDELVRVSVIAENAFKNNVELEERVEKLSGIVEILWNERIDEIQRNVSPDFWSDKF